MKTLRETRARLREMETPAHLPRWAAFAYLLAGSLWLLLFDAPAILNGASSPSVRRAVVADLGFVVVTAAILYLLLRRYVATVHRQVDALQQTEQLLRQLTEHLDEVFWLAELPAGRITYVNPAYEKVWQRGRADVIGAPAIWHDSLHPDDRGTVHNVGPQTIGETGARRYRIIRADGSVRWIVERIFPVRDEQGTVRRLAGLAQDFAVRISDPDLLDLLVEERTRELRTLVSRSHLITRMASTFESETVPDLILEHLTDVVEYRTAAIYTVENDYLLPLASHGLEQPPEPVKVSQLRNQPALSALAGEEKPLVVPDLQADTPLVTAVRDAFGRPPGGSGAWIGVPLVTPSTVGLLVADHAQSDYFTPEKTDLMLAFANQAAGAIENARLYERTQQRVAEAESLRRVTLALVQKHTLEELLALICREARDLIGAGGSFIFLKEGEERLRLAYRDEMLQVLADEIPMTTTHTGRAMRRGEPAVINEQTTYREDTTHGDPSIESLLTIPLQVEGQVIGALDIVNKPGGFTDHDVRTLSRFADAAALAIERARLQRQAEQLAVMRERQRLARELHDSVTQALYSMTLHTRASQMALRAGDRTSALESIQEMGDVARQATLDMRRLIFELRPPALETEGLVNALKMRLASVESRAGLKTEMNVIGEPDLPFAVEEELFWIASEALNNIIKHARAEQVTVTLAGNGDEVRLLVEDDGTGFEPAQARGGGGIGLRSMAERAEKIDGKLRVERRAGGGTRVAVVAGLPPDKVSNG